MPQEIERKFSVEGDEWRSLASPKLYRQGYIYTEYYSKFKMMLTHSIRLLAQYLKFREVPIQP